MRSGFCNPTIPRTTAYDPHQKCPGCDCTADGCPCNPQEPPPDPLVAALGELRATAEHIAQVGHGEDRDWRDTLTLLAHLRESLRILGVTDALMVRHAYLTGEHGETVIDGVGVVRVHRGRTSERWDGRSAVLAAVDRHMADRDGEIPAPHVVVDWVLDVAGVGYCRKTALRELALDPADYYYSEPGPLRVTLPPT